MAVLEKRHFVRLFAQHLNSQFGADTKYTEEALLGYQPAERAMRFQWHSSFTSIPNLEAFRVSMVGSQKGLNEEYYYKLAALGGSLRQAEGKPDAYVFTHEQIPALSKAIGYGEGVKPAQVPPVLCVTM